ncbi:MAG: HAD family hydrolase [Candidatus Bathyarchaeota archaeon]|nr:MAG: HAD family hydrolase [Candidatus Bathyarchaeota archaeon]
MISFDVGGTLVDHNFTELVWNNGIPKLYAEKTGINLEDARVRIAAEYEAVGREDLRWYTLQYWFDLFDLDGSPREMFELFRSEIRIYPEVPSVLEILERQYDLTVISGHPKDMMLFEIAKLQHHFKYFFSSVTDFNKVRKTSDMYAQICVSLGIEPRQVLHIGDDKDNDFKAPREAGMQAVYLDRSGRGREDLTLTNLEELLELLSLMRDP